MCHKGGQLLDLNLYLLIAIVAVSVIFLLSLITLIAVRCHRTESSFSRYSAPMITTHPDGSWSYSKSTQQYDVCFSSDTLKSDVVVFPAPFPPVDAELISINGGDTFTRTQTLPNSDKDKNYLDINRKTGVIFVNEKIDREELCPNAVRDKGVPPRLAHGKVLVEVIDVNDNAPEISITSMMSPVKEDAEIGTAVAMITVTDRDGGKNGLTDCKLEPVINIYVKENSQIGSLIYTLTSSDLDSTENAKVSYSLLNFDKQNVAMSSVVNINSETGEIVTLQTFNFEESKRSSLKCRPQTLVSSSQQQVTVNVFILDENDNSPTILAPYSEHGSVNSESIPYSAEAGYFVAKIRAVDADSGYNALLSYHLSEPKGTTCSDRNQHRRDPHQEEDERQ
ncbi:hypothetical protein WMY93_009650 [Mugilogobius chulae]|uniref:Cadherin domain-containing protein n=1 Tax=Mugilogobius chulae TaxID=88201 RepID=A0AAW0PFG0_9GOBI